MAGAVTHLDTAARDMLSHPVVDQERSAAVHSSRLETVCVVYRESVFMTEIRRVRRPGSRASPIALASKSFQHVTQTSTFTENWKELITQEKSSWRTGERKVYLLAVSHII